MLTGGYKLWKVEQSKKQLILPHSHYLYSHTCLSTILHGVHLLVKLLRMVCVALDSAPVYI